MQIYLSYKLSLRQKDKENTEYYLSELRSKFEKSFTYEKLVLLRTIATKKDEFEQL